MEWLNSETGKAYRLLTEAEWEYVARAGTITAYWCYGRPGCPAVAGWFSSNAQKQTQPVGGKSANPFGLHDVVGNVYEWTEDCWSKTYSGAPLDGSAWTTGADCGKRVRRGGSWDELPGSARSANRNRSDTGGRSTYIGFRVARTF